MSGASANWTPVVVRGGEEADGPPGRAPRVTPAEPEAAAAAAAADPVVPGWPAQRVGVRQGEPAAVHPGEAARARARPPAPARVKNATRLLVTSAGRELAAGLARDTEHGPPWQEQPPSLAQLRTSIHVRASAHDILPFAKGCYIAWGYATELPLTAAGYTLLWLIQAPARIAVIGIVAAILLITHVI